VPLIHRLARIPAGTLASIYLGAIPVFAVVDDVFMFPQKEGFGYGLRSLEITGLRADDADLTFETSFVRGLPRSYVNLSHRLRWSFGLPGDTNAAKQLPTRIDGIPEFLRGALLRQREPHIGGELHWGPLRGSFAVADSSVFEGYIFVPDDTYELARRLQEVSCWPQPNDRCSCQTTHELLASVALFGSCAV